MEGSRDAVDDEHRGIGHEQCRWCPLTLRSARGRANAGAPPANGADVESMGDERARRRIEHEERLCVDDRDHGGIAPGPVPPQLRTRRAGCLETERRWSSRCAIAGAANQRQERDRAPRAAASNADLRIRNRCTPDQRASRHVGHPHRKEWPITLGAAQTAEDAGTRMNWSKDQVGTSGATAVRFAGYRLSPRPLSSEGGTTLPGACIPTVSVARRAPGSGARSRVPRRPTASSARCIPRRAHAIRRRRCSTGTSRESRPACR